MSGNTVPEYKVQETKRSKLILLHYGIFKIGWDWMILLCTFYIAITVPYNAAFVMTSENGFTQRASIVSDVIVEMLLAIGQSLQSFVIHRNTLIHTLLLYTKTVHSLRMKVHQHMPENNGYVG